MKLALSTAAAPDYSLSELLDACARRGLAAIELVEGDGHGVGPGLDHHQVLGIVGQAARKGIAIAAYRVDDLATAAAPETVRLAFGLGAPVIARSKDSEYDVAEFAFAAQRFSAVGARLLLEHRSDLEEIRAIRALAEQIGTESIALAWDADPANGGLERAGEVIAAAGPLLHHIRLRGGGPEAAQGEGLGIGSLIGRLTLARYRGHLAIAPSTPRYRVAWDAWLGRQRGGWGCGSKASDPSLVSLG